LKVYSVMWWPEVGSHGLKLVAEYVHKSLYAVWCSKSVEWEKLLKSPVSNHQIFIIFKIHYDMFQPTWPSLVIHNTANPRITRLFIPRNHRVTWKHIKWITDNFSSSVTAFLCFLHLQIFLSQLGLLLFPIALKMNELRSTPTGQASSSLPLTLILVRCDQLVHVPHSHATTVHGDCKITVQFSHGFFPLNRVIAKTCKVRSCIMRVACIYKTLGRIFRNLKLYKKKRDLIFT
jgi:hypothetical protein